jgi:thiol-disulfide isomerase/thioredoxin
MKSLKTLSISLLAVILVSACTPKEASEKTLEVLENTPEKTIEKIDENIKENEKEINEEKSLSSIPFSVENYTAARFAALKGNTPVVINFHATWCPVCRSLDKKLEENMAQLPTGAVMLKADFDDEVALKKELGITQQTTLVFYDNEGNEIAKKYNPSIEKISELLSS